MYRLANSLNRPLVIASVLAASASVAVASPDTSREFLGEAFLLMGDCGAQVAVQSAEYREFDTPAGLARAAEILAQSAEYTGTLGSALQSLCENDGFDSCDAAAKAYELSADLDSAGRLIVDGDLKSAATALRSALVRYDEVFSFTSAGTLPDALRERFDAAIAALRSTARVLDTLADPAEFEAYLKPALGAAAEGPEAMLDQLRTIEGVAWPEGFLGAELVEFDFDPSDWKREAAPAVALAGAESQAALATWGQLGAIGILERNGGAIVLSTLHRFGTNLRDGMYGLRAEFDAASEEVFGCEFKCQSDDDCGPCHLVKAGFGHRTLNPDDLAFNDAIVEMSIEIDISMPANQADRDAIYEAIVALAKKGSSAGDELWIMMEYRKCVVTMCWLIDEESDCESDRQVWIRVPLPLGTFSKPASRWSDADWTNAASKAEDVARDWCDDQQ